MSSSTAGKHASSGAAQPAVAEPTFAERARTLMHLGRVGGLSTLSRKQPEFPFGSVMPYALDDHANPIFLISTMAMHTHNVQADSRSSLLVTQPDAVGDPLGASRVTLIGNVLLVPEAEVTEVRKLYLAHYADSKYWVDFDDFSFYRMNVVDVYYVGGFGVMGWVSASEYYSAQPDPLADSAIGIIQHMNADHGDALILLAKAFAGIEAQEAAMTSVDRLGFHVLYQCANSNCLTKWFTPAVRPTGCARTVPKPYSFVPWGLALSEKQTPQVVEKSEKAKEQIEGVESSFVLRRQTLFPTELRARWLC